MYVANLERDCFRAANYYFGMLSKWLHTTLSKNGMTQSDLARRLTEQLGRSIDRAAVNKMLSGLRKISADELLAIETITGEKFDAMPGRAVRVKGKIGAGPFRETWQWEDDEQYDVVVPLDETLDKVALYGGVTCGPSMNRRYPEGTVVVFTDAMETQEPLVPGARYVIERERPDGLREATIKLLHRDDFGRFWMVPESTHPDFQLPMPIDGDNGDVIRIVGRVRFAVIRE